MPLKTEQERQEPALEMEEYGGASPKELEELLVELMEKLDRTPRIMEEALEKTCKKLLSFGQETEFLDEILEEKTEDMEESWMPAEAGGEEQEVRGNMEIDLLMFGAGGAGEETKNKWENGSEESIKERWMPVVGGGGGEEQEGRGNMDIELLRLGVGGSGKERKSKRKNKEQGNHNLPRDELLDDQEKVRILRRWMPVIGGGGGEEQEGRGNMDIELLRSGVGGSGKERKSKWKNKEQGNYNLPRDELLDEEKVRILRLIIWKQEEGRCGLLLRQEDHCYKHERQKETGLI